MANKTITAYEYTCDLCGARCDEVELSVLFSQPRSLILTRCTNS